MANVEHLSLIRQGAEIWNQWLRNNPEARPDLSWAKLKLIQALPQRGKPQRDEPQRGRP